MEGLLAAIGLLTVCYGVGALIGHLVVLIAARSIKRETANVQH